MNSPAQEHATVQAAKKPKTGLPRLLEIAGTKKWWLLASMVLSVASTFAQFVPFVAAAHIVREIARNAARPEEIDHAYVEEQAFLSLKAIFLFGLLLYFSLMLSHIAAFNILYELRVAVARKMVKIPLGFFSRRGSGELKKIMSEDVERIELFVAHHIPDLASAIALPVITLSYLAFVEWRLTIVVSIVFIAALSIQSVWMFRPSSRLLMERYHSALGQMNSSIVEYVRGIQVVKIFNRSVSALERLVADTYAYRDFSIGITKSYALIYTGFLTLLSSTLFFLIPAAIVIVSMAPDRAAIVPQIFLFLIVGSSLFFPLLKLMWIGSLLTQNSTGVALIDDILNRPEIEQPAAPRIPSDASIEFRDVSFSYESKSVLKEISFVARPGTITALVGPSGAGKSTIAMLCARFWDVETGEILIGGVPVNGIAVEELMKRVAFVFQDNMLFYDTIEENIRMGNTAASFDEVVRAAKAAMCHDFIEKLPDGYGTRVGEGGVYLSGGEQQRIAIARAVFKDAPILLLDEATAYADPENEGRILESFSHLIQGRTVLVIAHRLSTIRSADLILVIEDGRLVESGNHEKLLQNAGLYVRMWKMFNESRSWAIQKEKPTPEKRS